MSVIASGETISVANNYVFYTFLEGDANTIIFPSNTTAQVLIVGGGGGGGEGADVGAATNSGQGGGGGGAVGVGSLNFTANTAYTIKVSGRAGGNGGNSSIKGGVLNEIANGGGRGADTTTEPIDGGSGGGGSIVKNAGTGGSIITSAGTRILTYYGNAGGSGVGGGGGGGGGAGGPGANASGNNGGNGGIGYTWHMNGISYGGGGGGGGVETGGTHGTGVDGGGGGASFSSSSSGGINNTGGGGGGGIIVSGGTGKIGKSGGSGIVIIAVLNTTITNGSFDMNTTAIPANSYFYVSNSSDSKLFAGNQTFSGIGIYFPCWNFYARDASTNAIILANGNGGAFNVNYNNPPATQCLIIQQTDFSSPYSSYLTISQDVVFLKGTYVLTYSAAPRSVGYISGQVLSASISSSTFGTTILKSPQSLPAGVWTTFNVAFYIFTPGVYTINFVVEANNASSYDSSIFFTGVTLTTTSQVPCFLEGSKILYLNPTTNFEEYAPIETLRKGDLIKTFSNGYKELAHIGQTKLFLPCMISDKTDCLYRLPKSKIRELKEDLCITGRHCVLHRTISDELREQLVKHMGDVFSTENLYRVPAWLDDRSEPYNNASDETVTVWHLALENENIYHNYGVWANGLLVETCSIVYLTQISDMELVV